MVDVKGRWALVTGAARGIGYGAALFLAERGCNLILHGRTAGHCAKVLEEAVAKAEDIKVEGKDLDQEVAMMAMQYGATPKQIQKIIKEQGRLGDLAATVLRKKTAQFIIDSIA
jgi:short-subunit dehydrogenase